MFDETYSYLVRKFDYRLLAALTPAVAALFVVVILFNGLEYGLDFKGGMWMDALTDNSIDAGKINAITGELEAAGLKDVKADVGFDVNTGMNKLNIQTTTVLEDNKEVKGIIARYAGDLTDYDTATVKLSTKPPAGLKENLVKRLKYGVDLEYGDGTLTVRSLDLNKEELDSALSYYLTEKVEVKLAKKNFNMRSVGPTLGETFRSQGFKALFASFVLMSIVVFFAFREFIPCVAVIQAAVCDILIALGGMSLLHIPLEPASIGALLMLIGYSVDTDIMLTTRTLKDRSAKFDELVDDAVKTGLTMTGTTLTALVIIYIISVTLTQIPLWSNIAAVLIIGLLADIPATWLTNAGMIKWYVESGGRHMKLLRRRR
ncbi:MAG: hypothetical protein V1744_01810 [Candidatus Altiarchaeota archaeon]